MKRAALLSIGLLAAGLISAADTLRLTLPAVIRYVQQNHPMLRQGNIVVNRGDVGLRLARGMFDPKLYLQSSNKYYAGKEYYQLLDAGLKVPTWFGIEGFAGREQARGEFLNPDNSLPANGLTYAGVSVPLGRDLITDRRRTALAKAKLMLQESEFQRQSMLNELFAEVVSDYASWYTHWLEVRLYEEAVKLTELRLAQLRNTVAAGARAAIDTLETDVLRRNFMISLRDAEGKLFKSRMMLSVHLWNNNGEPLEPDDNVFPSDLGLALVDSMAASWPLNRMQADLRTLQPGLQEQFFKIRSAEVDLRLQQQYLLPDIRLKYNVLSEPFFNPSIPGPGLWNNYQWGIDAGLNLFMRQERAQYKIAGLALESARLRYDFKQLETVNKLRATSLTFANYSSIFTEYSSVVDGYLRLYQAEQARLDAGESDLFIVNTRELRWVESRLKEIEYQRKYLLSGVEYVQAAGQYWRLAE
jgi:outer membrane protein TolC